MGKEGRTGGREEGRKEGRKGDRKARKLRVSLLFFFGVRLRAQWLVPSGSLGDGCGDDGDDGEVLLAQHAKIVCDVCDIFAATSCPACACVRVRPPPPPPPSLPPSALASITG